MHGSCLGGNKSSFDIRALFRMPIISSCRPSIAVLHLVTVRLIKSCTWLGKQLVKTKTIRRGFHDSSFNYSLSSSRSNGFCSVISIPRDRSRRWIRAISVPDRGAAMTPTPQEGPKRALITGASRGIGHLSAQRLAAQGVEVGLLARSAQVLDQVVADIQQAGGRAHAYPCDLSDLNALPAQLDRILKDFGPVDLLVNNAGMGYTGSIASIPLSDWQRVLDLNLTAAFLCIQAVLPGMQQGKQGTIINVISIAGKQTFPNWGAYCASKFGLMGLTQALAQEERSHGIRVMAFCPGPVDTALWDSETVQADFDRSQMLRAEQVADSLVNLAFLPSGAVVDEMVLMPVGGAL